MEGSAAPNRLLATIGVILIAIAACGLFLNENQPLSGTFLFFGVVTIILSVFEPRMEGEQTVTPTRLGLNLSKIEKSISQTETQRQVGNLIPLDDVRPKP